MSGTRWEYEACPPARVVEVGEFLVDPETGEPFELLAKDRVRAGDGYAFVLRGLKTMTGGPVRIFALADDRVQRA